VGLVAVAPRPVKLLKKLGLVNAEPKNPRGDSGFPTPFTLELALGLLGLGPRESEASVGRPSITEFELLVWSFASKGLVGGAVVILRSEEYARKRNDK
jgi:hypothetical protein